MRNEGASDKLGCAIAVMAKASIPARKDPPDATADAEQAAELNTAFLRDVACNLLAASEIAHISPWMAYAPAGSRDFFSRILPDRIGLLETVAPDFGLCLFHAAASLLEAGRRTVCLLNSDSPTLPRGIGKGFRCDPAECG